MKIFKNIDNKQFLKEFLAFIYAVIFAFVFRSVVYEPNHIPSGSMKPNLIEGDYIFVSKFAYGYSKYSFPLSLNFFSGRIFEYNKPKRGDIVVFRPPGDDQNNYIKRLIGLPGDKIEIKNSHIYINDLEVKKQYIGDYRDIKNPQSKFNKYFETIPPGIEYKIIDEINKAGIDNMDPVYVPENHYFFMGDNRDNSHDSRIIDGKVGFVPSENIVGRAEIIFFSSGSKLYEPWKWLFSFKPNRFLINLHPTKIKDPL